jgi:hypothetical protein
MRISGSGNQRLRARFDVITTLTTPALADASSGQSGPAIFRDVSPHLYKKGLLVLILVGCIIRVGYFVEHSRNPAFAVPTLDQKYYDTVARMLVAREDLHQLHGFKPLLYPMFLAALYKLSGGAALPLAIVIQHGLGVATGLIVALLSAYLFRNRLAGLIAGAIYLLAPLPLMFEGELLVESSYTFLICLSLLVHLKAAERCSRRSNEVSGQRLHPWCWLLGGGLTVLAAQARPNILVFLAVYPLFALWLWSFERRQPSEEPSSVNPFIPLLGLVGALCMGLLWGCINLKQSRHFHLLSGAGGVNLYLGNKRGSKGITAEQERRVSYSDRYQDAIEVWAREEYDAAMRDQGQQPQDDDPTVVSRYWTGRAFSEIRADPFAWVRLLARKTWLMLWNTEIPNNKSFAFFQQESVWLHLLPVRWVMLLMLAPVGICAAVTRGNRNALFVVVVLALFYSAGNILFFISDRYRYPIWPVMAVIAGGGLVAVLRTIQSRNIRALSLVGLSIVAMAAISLPNWAGVQLPTFARDYLFRSIAWSEKGHFPESLKDIDQSLKLDPADPSALQQRGIVLFALERPAESKTSFEQALELSPGEGVTWNNLGVVYERLGETNAALGAFVSATRCKPPSRNAFINLAALQIRSSLFKETEATVGQLEKLTPSPDAASLALRSVLARSNGDNTRADALETEAGALDRATTAYVLERAGRPARH